MIFKNYYSGIIFRVLLITLTGFLATFTWTYYQVPLITAHVIALIALQTWFLIRYLNKWNRDLHTILQSFKSDDVLTSGMQFTVTNKFNDLVQPLSDISKSIRNRLRQHEVDNSYFKIVTDKVATGILVCTTDGKVHFCNPAAHRLFGINAIRNINDLNQTHHGLDHSIGKLNIGEEVLIPVSAKNQNRFLQIKASGFKAGNLDYKIYAIDDIGREIDRKEIESWQKLIRVLNHEVMNSLAPINSTVHMLADNWSHSRQHGSVDEKLVNKTVKGLNIIHERADGLQKFIQAYRSLTKLPVPNLAPIDISIIIKNLIDLYSKELADRNINIELTLSEVCKMITTDQGMLQQILINLLRNSIDACENIDRKNSLIRITTTLTDEYVNIAFADDGTGMSQEVLQNATVPFFTTKEHGFGVGLSLVRQLLVALKGKWDIRSKEGGGTTVVIEIPDLS